ncbi:hypothetical protein F4808DRAFT_466574 [Astrocystis sublimbata]|nr:hypothetical protein F4808DRAFT_466574 [Astrocystis sublimbata]
MTDLHPESAWPQSHVVRKFINGLRPDFDIFLATWEIGITEIPVMGDNDQVITPAVTLEQATDAAVQFESGQKERAQQTTLLAGRAATPRQINNDSRGTKRETCGYCGKPHPPPCYVDHPELKPEGWDTEQLQKYAKYHEDRLKMLRDGATKGDSISGCQNFQSLRLPYQHFNICMQKMDRQIK